MHDTWHNNLYYLILIDIINHELSCVLLRVILYKFLYLVLLIYIYIMAIINNPRKHILKRYLSRLEGIVEWILLFYKSIVTNLKYIYKVLKIFCFCFFGLWNHFWSACLFVIFFFCFLLGSPEPCFNASNLLLSLFIYIYIYIYSKFSSPRPLFFCFELWWTS